MRRAAASIALLAVVTAVWLLFPRRDSRPPVVLSQEVYVWQRDWSPDVVQSVRDQSSKFHRIVVLAAEISWPTTDGKVVDLRPDYSAIRGAQVGIAIRIGPLKGGMPGATAAGSPQERLIQQTVTRALASARSANVDVKEAQLDYDCAESKLAGYGQWVAAVKSAIAPVPVVITALPSWLKQPAFATLAKATGGFVMQVHSLHKPTGPDDPMAICDPAEARRAVDAASDIGVPFRIALPTYGYAVAFKPDGSFLALSAEGPTPDWPAGTLVREMRTDPGQMASLIHDWTTTPPANCTGIIWYRLPVTGDRLNWASATLATVMAGRLPVADVRAEIVRSEPKLCDVFIVNHGDADAEVRGSVVAEWTGSHDVTAEGLGPFNSLEQPSGGVTFKLVAADNIRLTPGGRLQVGWIRLDTDTEVHGHVNNP